MGVVYYKYKSAKETYSVPLPYSFISVSELKQLILTSNRHGHGRTRGRGPREDIALSNAQTGEEYADENAMIPQNVTVLVRRVAGQMSENIVVFSSRKVIEDGSVASNRSVVTESVSKSCSSTEVQDEDAAIAAVIDGAELKWEEQPFKRGQADGKFTGRHYGHGPLGGEAPPPGYVCRSCGVAGHFIKHCPQESHAPPPGYTCFRCQIPGHFIHHCPTIGDPKFDDYKIKMSRSLAPVVSAYPVDGIPSALAPAASVSVVDDLPAELHCRLCNKVMADAVLTSKCCFDSFCDKCIRDYIITQSKCICGVKVLADDLIPNHTLRSTISNMLGTRATSTTASGTGKHKSSSGSNPDPKLQSPATSAASGRDLKQSMDHLVSSASPDAGVVQVAKEEDQVDRPQKNLDLKSKAEGSVGCSVERAVPIADPLKQKDVSESTLKDSTISGTLETKVARPDQLKKKRKKADSTKIVHPNNADYGYNVPFDPAYCNPFNGGYPMATDPYMYGSMGYGGYPMGPFGVNPFGNMPPQVPFGNMPPQAPFGNMPPQALAMQGYPANYQSWETHPAHREAEAAARSRQASHREAEAAARSRQPSHLDAEAAARSRQASHRDSEAALRSRQTERPKDTGSRPRPSERNQRSRSPHGRESRSRSRSRSDRRDHGRSDRASNGRSDRASNGRSDRASYGRSDRASKDYDEDHYSRKRMRASSPADGDKHSKRTSRHSSRSLARDDSSDDEQNFKRNWGHRSSVTMDARS